MPLEQRPSESGASVLALSGRLVHGRATDDLEAAAQELSKTAGCKVILDLSRLEYADSSGIGALVASLTTIKKSGGELRLAGVTPRIQRLLSMTGVDRLIPQYPTVSAAAAG